MKYIKKFVSIIVILLLLLNCMPISYALYESNNNVLTINGSLYDAITNVEYGWDGKIYRFNNEILSGIKNDDEVYLVADVKTSDSLVVSSSVNIELYNFRLEGADKHKYLSPVSSEQKPINKTIYINKKTIKISPQHPYIYYGQEKPTEISEISDYTSQIVNNEDINISTIFEIEEGSEIGEYSISIKQNKITIQGNDADNYNVILDKDVKFSVYKYEPDVQAICNEVQDGNFVGVTKATINSPYGFLISEKKDKDNTWEQSIDIDIIETNEGAYTYYLRNNNSLDEEYYKAISEPKIYSYTSVQTIPTVKSIKIIKIEEDTTLSFLDSGVLSNGKVGVVVYVEGGAVAQDTTIYLVAEEGYYESKRVDAQQAVFVDNKYTYTQTFELDCDEDQVTVKNLKAYAVNSSGESDKYPTIGTNDTFVDTQTKADKPITIDKANPNVEIQEIYGNYQNYAIRANFTVSDLGSGIAKIEYLWDDGFLLNVGDEEYQTDYVEFKDYSIDKSEYELILPWNLSQNVSGDKHTLHLRVTDKAGNIFNISKTDDIGSDMLPPNIESVEIRKAENNQLDSILNFFTFGTFSNNTVEIAVKVNDNESNTDRYSSGVEKVEINGTQVKLNHETNEYILKVNDGNSLEELCITVTDAVDLRTSSYAVDIPDHGFIKSNNLIVEDDAPVIDFGDILNQGHKDNEDNIWFGYDDNKVEMKITVSDNQGQVQSGLYSVTIKDNGKIKYSNSNFQFKTEEFTQKFIIGNLEDGQHIFSVEVVDNCGNKCEDYITFYKDSSPPKDGEISVYSPQSTVIDSNMWFDKEDIVTFRIQAFDDLSGLKNIQLKINNKVFEYNYSQIKQDQEGYYILVETTDIEVDNEHKYNISGKVIDFANNVLELDPLTIYKDFENPVVEKFTVENKTNVLDKILNILSFGIYSNDSLILKAYTKDGQFDSGIDYATVTYDGLYIPRVMKNEGNGVFSVEITAEDKVFQSDINIVVYDKYGKSSLTCPNISNVDGSTISDGRFVMIETMLPTISINMPASDSIVKTDSKVWYNSNKNIEFKVIDEHSGINNIDLFVNGIRIEKDLNDTVLLNTQITESAPERNNNENIYIFDTDYITSLCGEAIDGKYEISAIITDNAGNKTNYKTTYYIDKNSPNVDNIEFIPKTSDGIENTSEFIEKLEYGYYFKTDFTVLVNISDDNPSSGLYQLKYRFMSYSKGEFKEEISGFKEIIDGKVSLDVPKDFKGQIFVEVFDNVLNRSGEKTSKAYVVDKVEPNIEITKNADTTYHDEVGNNLYVDTNSFTVVITDTVSGVKQIGYMQSSEQNSYDRKNVYIDDSVMHNLKDDLGDGWIVTGVDTNLVTQISKTFTFANDDNDIILTFDATDNADNKVENINSEKFTIDKTNPIINVDFRDNYNTDAYYNHNRIADITVIERNFDEKLIDTEIKNMFGDIPTYSFVKKSNTVYTAVIEFDEGDYEFDIQGKDLGNHTAIVNFSGGNENLFYVDKTVPLIEENFSEFSNSKDNSFNVDKTATIKIIEHNFDPDLTNLKITRKEPGLEHNQDEFQDVTNDVLGATKWNSSGDIHTISITFDIDAIYYIEIMPLDLASNTADKHNTVIFEIDKTVPVVSMRNDVFVGEDSVEFFDAYPYSRKDDEKPIVQFEDLNISHIKYELTTYIPNYTTGDIVVVNPVTTSGVVEGDKFKLPNFTDDGVYTVKLIAVDIAGNESDLNFSTYARMVNQDVLAFIMDSNLERKSGLYSLQYENGDAISKKASNFNDLKIFVMAKKDTPVDVVLRDYNGNSISTNAECTINDSIYGMQIYNYLIKSEFFKETFQEDTDIELQLTVENMGYRIDLSKIHIDNIAPDCNIPKELSSWHWFYGENNRTLTISNISELIDQDNCKIYDNGVVIPFEYSSDDNTITFTLAKGWHNVGIIVVDEAGNANNNQEIINIHIGYFWLWFIIILTILITMIVICIIVYNREQKSKKSEDI